MKATLLIAFLITSCATQQQADRQKIDKKAMYNHCIQTFQDAEKCRQFVASQSKQKQQTKKVALAPEVEKQLKIRDDLKDQLQSKNKLYVKNQIGEPDKSFRDSSGRTHFVYYRPIARYSAEHDPDIEIDVIFIRNRVSRVNHTPPPTTPSRFDLFTNKFK